MTKRTERGSEPSQGDAVLPDGELVEGGNGSQVAGAEGVEVEVEVQPDPVAVAQQEVAALRDQMLRLAADFDNYRKRAMREQQEVREYGNTNLLNDVLPVLDNLERALAHAEGDNQPLVQGVRLVVKQFVDVLTRYGVTGFPSVGVPFDPERHEAVAQLPTADQAPGTILEELQRGYMLRERLLRPSRVVVAAPAAKVD
jgi:molecular chaperone GrpE